MSGEIEPVTKTRNVKAVGRPVRSFSNPQVGKMLGLLRSGFGRVTVCEQMEVSYKTFQKLMRNDENFAQWVREAEFSRVEGCEAAIFRMAMSGYNSPVVLRAALSYLGRRDKLDDARRGRRDKARKAAAKEGE